MFFAFMSAWIQQPESGYVLNKESGVFEKLSNCQLPLYPDMHAWQVVLQSTTAGVFLPFVKLVLPRRRQPVQDLGFSEHRSPIPPQSPGSLSSGDSISSRDTHLAGLHASSHWPLTIRIKRLAANNQEAFLPVALVLTAAIATAMEPSKSLDQVCVYDVVRYAATKMDRKGRRITGKLQGGELSVTVAGEMSETNIPLTASSLKNTTIASLLLLGNIPSKPLKLEIVEEAVIADEDCGEGGFL